VGGIRGVKLNRGFAGHNNGMALRKPIPELDDKASKPIYAGRQLRRWIIPIGGGLLAGILIVLSTPHVAGVLRIALGIIAFAYVCGQSAAYLWTGDQGA
jgi:hypothetical protein